MTSTKPSSSETISSSGDALIVSSTSSASSLMALQLFSRIFTFILNQALLRLVSPTTYGAAAIQFELILSTILFLSREGVRNALLRVNKKSPETMNLSFVPVLFGFPLALVTCYLYVSFAAAEVKAQHGFRAAVMVYAAAALVELASEPMHNIAMTELKTNIRVRAEGLGITCKSIATFLILYYDAGRGKFALLAFAGGQLTYGAVVLSTYVAYFGRKQLWPKLNTKTYSHSVDRELLGLSLTMTSQSVVKHFLTEGDKFVLSWFSPLEDQGGYAIAVNYGSLIARIVFQPIEESLRVFFSKILPSSSERRADQKALTQAANALTTLLSVQTSLSLLFVIFGSSYISIILPLLLPSQYLSTSAPKVLSAWIWYIPVLAVNGALEAFLSSVATPSDLNKQSRWMVGFSVIYISAAIVLYRLNIGDASLVYANIINLSARIVYCLFYVYVFFSSSGTPGLSRWRAALPSSHLMVASVVSSALIWASQRWFGVMEMLEIHGRKALLNFNVVIHVGLGGFLALFCLYTWWLSSGRSMLISVHSKSE